MSIFLSIVFGLFGLLALVVVLGLFWLSKKAKLAEGYVVYAALSLGIEALKQYAAKPENASDADATALIVRAEAAQKSGKAALDNRNVKEAVALMAPAIEELGNFKTALDKKRAEAAQAAPPAATALGAPDEAAKK